MVRCGIPGLKGEISTPRTTTCPRGPLTWGNQLIYIASMKQPQVLRLPLRCAQGSLRMTIIEGGVWSRISSGAIFISSLRGEE